MLVDVSCATWGRFICIVVIVLFSVLWFFVDITLCYDCATRSCYVWLRCLRV